MHYLIGSLLLSPPEYPTLYPVHENPYVVGTNEGIAGSSGNGGLGSNGIGYVESNQPFHSKSARIMPTVVVLSIVVRVLASALLLAPEEGLGQHIR